MIAFLRRPLGVLLAATALGGLAVPAAGQSELAGGPPARSYASVAGAQAGAATRNLALGRGKSALVDLPVDARDVTVTNPAVADVVMRTPRRITVMGVAPGQTDAVFFDGMGNPILSLNVRVDQDASAVAQTLQRVLPGSRITVEAVNNSLVLTGQVASGADADRAQQIAAQFVANPQQVLNMLSIAGKDQVMLKVQVVEVQRTSIKQLGFNMGYVFGQIGGNQWASTFTPTWGVNNALLGGMNGGFVRDTTQQPILQLPCTPGDFEHLCPTVVKSAADAANFNAAPPSPTAGSDGFNKGNGMMQAFERAGLVRTLAEPNLTAVSGEAARFLVGGEFPVPTGQDSTGRVTIEFKPFGVGLGFTPIVLSGGRISLKLSTEVSELTTEGAFSLNTGAASSLVIPALKVRRAETTVELPSGGAMMIAGLLQDQTKQSIDSLPGLMNLPILGTLFRSRDFQNGETELVIIVTPYVVSPSRPGELQTPADGLQIAEDGQAILMGRLNKTYNAPPQALAGKSYQGPHGYVIE